MLGPFPPLETSFGGTDLHALFRWLFQNTFLRKKFHGVLLKLLSADTG